MGQNLDLNVNVITNQADSSLGSLKKQLKEAQAEVTALADKFGVTSKEAIEAAKRAADLRDRIGDAKALTDAFNPDAKFKALTASLSGVAGGFAAVQGAMGLFGAESENVQKTLLKVQSAMAISQGLQSVGESIDSFRQLGAVIQATSVYQAAYNFIMGDAIKITKEAVVTTEAQTVALETEAVATVEVTAATTGATIAMRVFRAALIATGIGAIVVLFGFLIEKLNIFTSDTKKAKEAQDELNASLSALTENLNLEVKALERANKFRVAKLKEQGASEAQIVAENKKTQLAILEAYEDDYRVRFEKYQKQLTDIKKIEDKEQKKAAIDSAENLRKQLISDNERNKDLRVQIRIDALDEIKRQNDAEEEARKKSQEARKKSQEDRKKSQEEEIADREAGLARRKEIDDFEVELQQRLMELDKEKATKKRELSNQETKNLINDIDYENKLLDNDFEADQQRLINKEAYLAKQKEIELSNLDLDENAKLEIKTKYANLQRDLEKEIADSKKAQREAEKKADQELQEAKYQIAQVGLGLLSSLAGDNERLANIIFAISKALEIGKIISSTAASIAQVNAGTAAVPAVLPPGSPNPAFPFAVAIGAKKIASLKIGAVASIATIAAASIAKFKSGSGGGGGGGVQGGGTISSEAPIIPQLPQAQTTNISRQSINDMGNQAVRAYVIETDVTGNQQRMAAIRQRARFS